MLCRIRPVSYTHLDVYKRQGIYVGYKFYETAAAEGLIDYDKVVQYPVSYTHLV